ncbi:hypothetical protein E2562_037098 [Oryza meyeriana var. granulata]|uniref:Secreted protein n=1 Tax=Oryza meyeriana var. granulata TaxID=110450 RepID=A0A6G1DAS7_9ORYZ|nr:hypothetical protein E2562_037098 [Oryza meyeriana var. granulata]
MRMTTLMMVYMMRMTWKMSTLLILNMMTEKLIFNDGYIAIMQGWVADVSMHDYFSGWTCSTTVFLPESCSTFVI